MFRWADPKLEAPKIAPTPPDPRLHMIKWFAYSHLPEGLKQTSAMFSGLALWMLDNIPPGPEAAEAMRQLLIAKDCAVRATMDAAPPPPTPAAAPEGEHA